MHSRGPRMTLRALTIFIVFLLAAGSNPTAAEEIEVGGTGAALGTMRILLDAYAESRPDISGTVLPSLGSSGGIKAVLDDAIDLAVAARPPKPDELAAGAVGVKYATTAIVPVVAAGNPTSGLSSSDLVAIYRGHREVWSDGTTVRVVLRPKSETDTKLLNTYIPEIESATDDLRMNPAIPVAYTDQENADRIQQMPGGFGLAALSLIRSEARPLRVLTFDGRAPDVASIADGSYPMTKPFYFVTNGAPSPLIRDFIAFVLSPEGNELLRQTGHAPERDSV